MKIVSTVARYLLGFVFVVFGLNGFLHFIPQTPPPSPLAVQYFTALVGSHYMAPIFLLQLIAGVLLLVNLYVPLALAVLAGIIANILLYHITMDPGGIGLALLVTVLWIVVFLRHRASFRPLFNPRPEPDSIRS